MLFKNEHKRLNLNIMRGNKFVCAMNSINDLRTLGEIGSPYITHTTIHRCRQIQRPKPRRKEYSSLKGYIESKQYCRIRKYNIENTERFKIFCWNHTYLGIIWCHDIIWNSDHRFWFRRFDFID